MPAQGTALGMRPYEIKALKGRHNRCLALSGLGMFLAIDPRALPWAGISRPFGADRAISTMQVIEELIKLAKDLDAATKAGREMGLTDDEKAFYDALAANDSAVTAMGDAKLKVIAAELITQVKKIVTIDWTLRESARAKIKVMVKRILNKHGYPPDLQEEAVKTVLAQAELLCAEWV